MKQLLKAVTMLVAIVTLAFASALATSAATSAQNSESLVVNIPFEFSIAGKTLPAGEYIVTRATQNDQTTMSIKNANGKGSALVMTKTVDANERQRQSRLVFNRYGSHYFLSQVWTSGQEIGRELYKGKQERSLEMELAKNNQKPETVAIAVMAR